MLGAQKAKLQKGFGWNVQERGGLEFTGRFALGMQVSKDLHAGNAEFGAL